MQTNAIGPPTRAEGLRRLHNFLPRAGYDYAKQRNYDWGPTNRSNVSNLSPWVRHRLVLEKEIVAAVLRQHSLRAADKFIQEVFWRTYWKGWLELHPSVWFAYKSQVTDLIKQLDRDPSLRRRWDDATQGRTGIACYDAWAQELIKTGYLHNHTRMWFASIWIFTLELPWALGADFFLRHLLDGDPASNTLSWRWVAGLQTKGKTYLARPDNIAKYTGGRFDPRNVLSRRAAALRESGSHPAVAPPEPVEWQSDSRTGLLLTDEDMYPDFLLQGGAFRSAAVLTGTQERSPLGVSPPVTTFLAGAISDAVTQAAHYVPISVDAINGGEEPNDVLTWALETDLTQVVTAYTPVGPTAPRIRQLSEELSGHGIRLVQVLRQWDHKAWPHATRGFFPFKEKIPQLLASVVA